MNTYIKYEHKKSGRTWIYKMIDDYRVIDIKDADAIIQKLYLEGVGAKQDSQYQVDVLTEDEMIIELI